ncbi:Conserved hypothetical, protein [Geosmithia morbida]|uniref:Conserved hypothetical, protein n=1 Tax=Geosmithia morbida TaxID=1094350 RepID=A0A9P4Z1P8_9HYPO|nr:Conserved hypothetical, protein [Geosmithia morbida]KAF4125812.1 Conserved hypothetical, protein [Geosmithia morbida]
MALDLWSHQFCLACDKQVESDSAAYCSEACRLAELERTSSPSSAASSPVSSPGLTSPDPWTAYLASSVSSTSNSNTNNYFFLSPAFDFSSTTTTYAQQPRTTYGSGNSSNSNNPTSTHKQQLISSSSNSSLSSMGSTSTTGDSNQLSSQARQELQAYAVSFDHVRTQRRRSY